VAKALAEAGANPTLLPAESRISDTPLTIAAGWRRADIVKFFLDNGAHQIGCLQIPVRVRQVGVTSPMEPMKNEARSSPVSRLITQVSVLAKSPLRFSLVAANEFDDCATSQLLFCSVIPTVWLNGFFRVLASKSSEIFNVRPTSNSHDNSTCSAFEAPADPSKVMQVTHVTKGLITTSFVQCSMMG
jgi:hypothetical protein